MNAKSRANIRLAFHLDKPAVIVDHAIHHGEAEPGPFGPLFRREKGSKMCDLTSGVMPDTGVVDADAGIAFGISTGEVLP